MNLQSVVIGCVQLLLTNRGVSLIIFIHLYLHFFKYIQSISNIYINIIKKGMGTPSLTQKILIKIQKDNKNIYQDIQYIYS